MGRRPRLAALIAGFAVFAALSSASRADEDDVREFDPLGVIARLVDDAKMEFVLRSNRVFRKIVCSVPYANYTLDALAQVTQVSKPALKSHVDALGRIGLVAWTHDWRGHLLIVPANETARARMRWWAEDICGVDDDCGFGG